MNHVFILYHSREHCNIETDRNIISNIIGSEPFTDNSKPTLQAKDLDAIQFVGIKFSHGVTGYRFKMNLTSYLV